MTAQLIAERYDLSPSWASSNLRNLYERCYLTRRHTGLDSGGIKFHYLRFKIVEFNDDFNGW